MGTTLVRVDIMGLRITVVPTPQYVSVSRVFVRHYLLSRGYEDLVYNACQITSELVSNAIQATGAGHPKAWGRIRLYLGANEGRPLLEVWDSSPEMPVLKVPDYINESGRGLHIVKELAAEFGWVKREEGGKTVWALLK
jgi:anti-sigma regulatory factor (Ser/Thr protein kinase)